MPTILLVEDDFLMSDLYETILTSEGYIVRKAVSGAKVQQMVQTDPPDLIIMDLMMPEMNGLEALDKLKADLTTRDVPVLMFSNIMDETSSDQALQKGAVRYAVKSDYRPRDLIKLVQQILSEKAAEQTT